MTSISANENWQKIPEEEAKPLREGINALHYRAYFNDDSSTFKSQSLPFFKNLKLVKATEHSTHPHLSMRFLAHQDTIIKLDGSPDSINFAHQKDALNLNRENIEEYVRFYFSCVNPAEGFFDLIETIDDLPLDDELDEKIYNDLSQKIASPKLIEENKEAFTVSFFLLHAGYLYEAEAFVFLDGSIEIKKEKLLLDGLPSRRTRLK